MSDPHMHIRKGRSLCHSSISTVVTLHVQKDIFKLRRFWRLYWLVFRQPTGRRAWSKPITHWPAWTSCPEGRRIHGEMEWKAFGAKTIFHFYEHCPGSDLKCRLMGNLPQCMCGVALRDMLQMGGWIISANVGVTWGFLENQLWKNYDVGFVCLFLNSLFPINSQQLYDENMVQRNMKRSRNMKSH